MWWWKLKQLVSHIQQLQLLQQLMQIQQQQEQQLEQVTTYECSAVGVGTKQQNLCAQTYVCCADK